jgi:hypothetical protein
MKSYITYQRNQTIHKVAVYLQDDMHKGVVYVKIVGNNLGKDVLEQAINQVLYGDVYSNEDCSQLLEDEFIHIYKYPRKKSDFVYLLERKYAEDFIIGVKIMDCTIVEYDADGTFIPDLEF